MHPTASTAATSAKITMQITITNQKRKSIALALVRGWLREPWKGERDRRGDPADDDSEPEQRRNGAPAHPGVSLDETPSAGRTDPHPESSLERYSHEPSWDTKDDPAVASLAHAARPATSAYTTSPKLRRSAARPSGHYVLEFVFAGAYFDGHFVESVPGFATNVPSRSVPSTTTSRPTRNRSGTVPV